VLFGRRRAGRWMREPGAPDLRHRGGIPWDAAPIPHRWHACRPQTVQLYGEHGVLTGTCRCACGAVTDRTGTWRFRNTRRQRDPARPRRARIPRPGHLQAVADTAPHPGARHRLRAHPGSLA
jgi:hypothetical protein